MRRTAVVVSQSENGRADGAAPSLLIRNEQEVATMALDMTAQLAPMMWAIVTLMVISSVALFFSHQN